jgi:heme A synthase
MLIGLMIIGDAMLARSLASVRPDLFRLSLVAVALVVAQGLVGRWVIFSGLALMATLTHAGLMAALFVVLAERIRRTWPWSSTVSATIERPLPGGSPVSAG